MARKPADQSVNKDDILFAAADVLRESGYDATTMKDIAGRVNLTAASLYHHFKNKDFLLLAVLERGLSMVIEELEPIVNANHSAAEKLAKMIQIHICNVTDNPTVGAAMVFEIRALMSAASAGRGSGDRDEFIERRNLFFSRRDHFENLFRRVIQGGIDAGEFRPVDVPIFIKTILGSNNWVGVWYRAGGRLNGSEIAERMADSFIHALKSSA